MSNKVYACSDLHGKQDLLIDMLNYLDEDDKLYFLGDAIDRGPNNIETAQMLLEDNRVVYIRGNHEAFLLDEYKNQDLSKISKELGPMSIWGLNGGRETAKEFYTLPPLEREVFFTTLGQTPFIQAYKNKKGQNILLCHAGFTPHPDGYNFDLLDRLLWDRNHINEPWDECLFDTIVVHGHTPVPNIIRNGKDPVILKYCDGHKIDIDLGSFATNKGALLDLDTLEPIYFYGHIKK